MTPTLLRETAIVYRCPFCRRSWRSQGKRAAERHLVHCFKNPERVPYRGEIREGAARIWDGKAWREVPGCQFASEWFNDQFGREEGEPYVSEWPQLGGEELIAVTPWSRRLRIFDDFDRAFARLSGPPDEGPGRIDDARLIRAIHGSAA